MNLIETRKYKLVHQYIISLGLVLIGAFLCFIGAAVLGYKTVALTLLMIVSIEAMLFDIGPVISASFLSALIWNFFFIPPIFTFHIEATEDLLMFLMYFFIACVNTVLTNKIRKEEKKVIDKAEKEKSLALHNTILNSLSHELRTPISTVIGATDTLKENKKILTTEQQNELLEQIKLAGLRLNRQVENLLNMSRLESGLLKPNLEWCDINELIYTSIQNIKISDGKTIQFDDEDHFPLIKLDRGLMEHVVLNLIENGINYTPPNSVISIKVNKNSENFILTISDSGNGVPEKELKHLFDKFYRLPFTKTGGNGLGLSIVKGFVEAHRGSIIASNNQKGGLTFSIQFPTEFSYLNQLNNE